jgi:hypothetical protein
MHDIITSAWDALQTVPLWLVITTVLVITLSIIGIVSNIDK